MHLVRPLVLEAKDVADIRETLACVVKVGRRLEEELEGKQVERKLWRKGRKQVNM